MPPAVPATSARAPSPRATAPAAPKAAAAPARKPMSPAQLAMRKLGLVRDIDLALHLPLRYEDETRILRIADTRNGDHAQVQGTVVHSDVQLQGRRQLKVLIDDGSDTLELRFFTFYPSHHKALAEGMQVRVRGEIRGGFIGRTMLHPSFTTIDAPLPEALTPVYPASAQLPQAYVRRAVNSGLQRADLSETLPRRADPYPHGPGPYEPAWTLADALRFLHHPAADVALATLEDRSHPAWRRLKAEELLAQQLSQLEARRARDGLRAPRLSAGAAAASALPSQLLAVLPFGLTGAQRRVVDEIAGDMDRPAPDAGAYPMHRLLQGDVGAGKTVVAALAACICIEAGHQCALMAPTEILAAQHFEKLVGWLQPLLAARGKQVAWLTGGQKKKDRAAALALVASGEAALVVGTHAVIQGPVVFASLALAVIDEQHRFGVAQRLALREKAGGEIAGAPREPHLLMMTATPIPRTLAMSYYADLDVSTLDELPPGRTPVVTKLVSDSRREEVVGRIASQLAQGRQVYWVCPLIEESEAVDLVNATQTHADLQESLPGTPIGLLHSRMPPVDKKAVMAEFTAGRMGVLVSTTVIEVGVDVPNASLMVIEHAERFGLSQLHQLRGRVGRGAAASACVLLYAPNEGGRVSEAARERLRAMAETSDGFEIARRDLEIRGPGEFLGARQSGAALLRFADLEADADLLEWARDLAPKMLHHDPDLAARHVARWLGTRSEFLKA